MKIKLKERIGFNSPVILGFTLISFVILLISLLSGGRFSEFLALRHTSWADPMMYIRLVTYCVTHQTMSHFTSNIMMILVIGPLVEEKYGSTRLLLMILLTSLIPGFINILFVRNVGLLGASGIVFMLILLASFTNIKEGTIPLTAILVAILYIGNEISTGILTQDNISQSAHIIGGVCGATFGFLIDKEKKGKIE